MVYMTLCHHELLLSFVEEKSHFYYVSKFSYLHKNMINLIHNVNYQNTFPKFCISSHGFQSDFHFFINAFFPFVCENMQILQQQGISVL